MATNKFTYDLTVTSGKLRLMIGDNQATDPFLWDDEIDAILAMGGSDLDSCAAIACRQMAVTAAHRATKVNIEGSSIVVDGTKTPDHFMKLAETFDKRAKTKPYSATATLGDDTLDSRHAMQGKWDEDFTDGPET